MAGSVVAVAAYLAITPGHAQDSLEYAVKATFLYKFAPFVEWPPGAFASPTSAVTLCVVGDDDPFGDLLDRAVAGQRVGNRPIAVTRLPVARTTSACHVMYVVGSAEQSVAEALAAVRARPVLTVTDATRDDTKGIIHFLVRDNRVRFEIDDAAAAENNLEISSKLLGLAVSVKPRARRG